MENELNVNAQKESELLETYKIRIRVMEENGGLTYLAILFGAASFEDLLSRLNSVGEIMEYDNGLIKDLRAAQEAVKSAKAEMETEMAEQEDVFAAYQEKQADLAVQQEEAADILESLEADSAEYAAQLASVKALQSSLTDKISNMEAQLAEQERIKAEQAAAALAAAQAAAGSGDKWYGDSAGTASGQEIVDYAMQFLGVKYVYGGTSPSGFDCSGLVYYCYRHFGYSINRTATAQSYNGATVSSSDLQPGDLVFFKKRGSSNIGHVGIYVGNGQFIHAPHTGAVVKISSLASGYYKTQYWGARRIV
jgi:cell wall-associated NlpC family hydrolase